MSFVGPVNRLGDTFVRPHDVELLLEPDAGCSEAMVERVVHLGFEVRVELVRDDGSTCSRSSPQEQAQQLELDRGQIVYVRPSRETVFSAAAKRGSAAIRLRRLEARRPRHRPA